VLSPYLRRFIREMFRRPIRMPVLMILPIPTNDMGVVGSGADKVVSTRKPGM
jgi:hypothetical protein